MYRVQLWLQHMERHEAEIRGENHQEGEIWKGRGKEMEGAMSRKEHRTGKNITAKMRKGKLNSRERRQMSY
jgi:hypothetical protein